jgi:hypothetical protein
MEGIRGEFAEFRQEFWLFLINTALGEVTLDKIERDAECKKEFGEEFHYALGFRHYTSFKFNGNDIELEVADTTLRWKDELAKLIKAKAREFEMSPKAMSELVTRELKFLVEDLDKQFA